MQGFVGQGELMFSLHHPGMALLPHHLDCRQETQCICVEECRVRRVPGQIVVDGHEGCEDSHERPGPALSSAAVDHSTGLKLQVEVDLPNKVAQVFGVVRGPILWPIQEMEVFNRFGIVRGLICCLLYTSPSPRD